MHDYWPPWSCRPVRYRSNQFLDIVVREGLRADHREESLFDGNYTDPTPDQQRCLATTHNDTLKCGRGFSFGDRLAGLAEVNSFSITSNECTPSWVTGGIDQNRYIVWRRNQVHSKCVPLRCNVMFASTRTG
jgi:hypothetical protein